MSVSFFAIRLNDSIGMHVSGIVCVQEYFPLLRPHRRVFWRPFSEYFVYPGLQITSHFDLNRFELEQTRFPWANLGRVGQPSRGISLWLLHFGTKMSFHPRFDLIIFASGSRLFLDPWCHLHIWLFSPNSTHLQVSLVFWRSL